MLKANLYLAQVIMKYLTETCRNDIFMIIGFGDNYRSQDEVTNTFSQGYPQLLNISQATVKNSENLDMTDE